MTKRYLRNNSSTSEILMDVQRDLRSEGDGGCHALSPKIRSTQCSQNLRGYTTKKSCSEGNSCYPVTTNQLRQSAVIYGRYPPPVNRTRNSVNP
ncbi:Hypothetical protein PP7435_CHR3-1171 [Komagataella phaffii CBS 7435]|uniref:Uncharacterized protein n=1 Tax=Komagataella phaffii (strain ATCC 76273 / CBS 7435 / CECT 11047 / NRRL Y-11430 / Wegner 21-1) TaxID=981350 RepID=F2QXI5_KOMPC|nr:Hypothetical protein BQ9382_C3-6178 [Komagataella phaffii CBS 7435]CCA40113.1 Hypothetical protein PP7435_CHR3-1171 [Komagataella phaffii CBS 7435]